MSQKHFDLHARCDDLETRNAELETKNAALKEKVSDLCFEVALLKDVCEIDEEDAVIATLKQKLRDKNIQECRLEMIIHAKDVEIAALKTEIDEKDAEISRLLIQDAVPIDINLGDVFHDQNEQLFDNQKMGEDLGDASVAQRTKKRKHNAPEMNLYVDDEGSDDDFQKPKKAADNKKKTYHHGPHVVLSDGHVSRRIPGARAYKSHQTMVVDITVGSALNEIFMRKEGLGRFIGQGHDYDGIRYANSMDTLEKVASLFL